MNDQTGVTVLLQEAAERAGREVLSPLLDQVDEVVDLDAPGAEDAVRNALIRALFEGVRLGAVETMAQVVAHAAAQGISVVPNLTFNITDPED